MKFLKKYLSILIVVIIFISSTVLIASGTFQGKEVNILMPAPFAESTKDVVNEFNIREKGKIKINVTKGPLETEAVSDLAISSLLLGKSPYDIILVDVTWLPKYAAANWLEPLDRLFSKEEVNELAEGAQLGNYYNKNLFRWPFVADIGLLYWRKDLMNLPPKTPNELLKASLLLKGQNLVKHGYVWQGRQYEGLSCVFLEAIHGFGGEWLDKSKNINLNSKAAIEAANWLNSLVETGASPKEVTNYSETEALQAFESGDAAFMRNWPYAWALVQKESSPIKGKVGVTTMVAKEGINPSSTLGSWGFSILKTSKNKQESAKVIKFLSSDPVQRKLFSKYGYTPTKTSIFKNKELTKKYEILSILEKALSQTKPRPQTPFYAQLSDTLQRELSSMLTGQINSANAMNNAQIKSEIILSSTGN